MLLEHHMQQQMAAEQAAADMLIRTAQIIYGDMIVRQIMADGAIIPNNARKCASRAREASFFLAEEFGLIKVTTNESGRLGDDISHSKRNDVEIKESGNRIITN